jgi:Protein of unknown function (DUF1045)
MQQWLRHAIYLAPPRGSALARFGADWLGWDPEAGEERTAAPVPALAAVQARIAEVPRRYGFHATLKAPFHMVEGRTAAELDAAAAALAAARPAFSLTLRVAAVGRFVALLAQDPPQALAALEADCVTGLDRFRAPLARAEIASRGPLDPGAAAHLARWGYPWVLDRFRFHMTLTGPLAPAEAATVRDALADALAPILAVPMPVDALCRFAGAPDGRFHLLARHPLSALT